MDFMEIKRRMFRRTETVEQIKVKYLDMNEEVPLAGYRKTEGGKFFLQIFRTDGVEREKFFACDLRGRIEIEQTPAGDFILVCKTALLPEQKMIGD